MAHENDVGEERAQAAALEYWSQKSSPAWPKARVQSVKREGPHYLVRLIPENRFGTLLFFVTYTVWVNASTGEVEKME
jgi:hypothetical protein